MTQPNKLMSQQGYQEPSKDAFRQGLHLAERPMYDLFLKTEGRKPESMWELIHYSVGMQERSKQERKFWGGILGL